MEQSYISSRTNPTVVRFASLRDKKGREKEGLYLIEGTKLCREALGRTEVEAVLLCEGKDNGINNDIAEKSGACVYLLSDGAFSKISQDNAPDGIIFVAKIPMTDSLPDKNERVIALECVRDPGNVGTAIRSAAAFGYDRVILCGCADLTNPKTVRATMGAAFKLSFTVCRDMTECVEKMKADGRRIIGTALSENSLVLGKAELSSSDCPIIGNEGHGITEETLAMCDDVMIIPMTDKTESLNAGVAATVIAWEYSKLV